MLMKMISLRHLRSANISINRIPTIHTFIDTTHGCFIKWENSLRPSLYANVFSSGLIALTLATKQRVEDMPHFFSGRSMKQDESMMTRRSRIRSVFLLLKRSEQLIRV